MVVRSWALLRVRDIAPGPVTLLHTIRCAATLPT